MEQKVHNILVKTNNMVNLEYFILHNILSTIQWIMLKYVKLFEQQLTGTQSF